MTAGTLRLLALHFAMLAVGVQLMASAVDRNHPSDARLVFIHLIGLGACIGWVLRGAWERSKKG